jgi:signal transduction histidine kinase
MTLRRRVMAALVALVALFTAIQGSIAVLSMHEQEDELVEELLRAETLRLASRIAGSGPALQASQDRILLPERYDAWWQGDAGTLPAPLPAPLQSLPDGPHSYTTSAAEYHVMVVPAGGGRLFVRHDTTRNEEKVKDFTRQVVVLALAFIALAAFIARYVAALLVAPLEQVARLLDHWAPASEPGATPPVDEEGRVFDAFRRVQLRWERGLAAEGERLADLHHEIRTPLTALRTDLEMLQGLQAGAADPRLQRSLAAVDAIADALQSTRAPRGGMSGQPEPVRLADCVDDAWASLGEVPEKRGLALVNEVPPQAEALLDRQALMVILRNLFRNAAEHAAPATLTVRHTGGELVVADDGPGIAAEDLAFVFERYYRGRLADARTPAQADDTPGDDERGLGLAIARQMAEANGWRLSVAAAAPRGTQFVLAFPDVTKT